MFTQNRHHSWPEIYEYYYAKGLTMFIMDRLSSLLIGLIIGYAPFFLFACFNLSQLSKVSHFSEAILPISEGWKKAKFWLKTCTIVFNIFNLVEFIQFIVALPRFLSLRQYFVNVLGISDSDLAVIQWPEVVDAVVVNDPNRHVSVLEIAQQILRLDNYMTAIFSDQTILYWKIGGKFSPIPLSQTFIYIFKLTLTGLVFDKSGCSLINQANSMRAPLIKRSLEKRFRLIGIVLALFSPFIFAFQLINIFFRYAQSLRSSLDTLSIRSWTPRSHQILREYNELPHIFEQRLEKSLEFANIYTDLFPSPYIRPIGRFLSFLSGALLSGFFILGLLTDFNLLFSIKLIGDKTVAWLMAILASVYAVSVGMGRTNKEAQGYTQEEAMEEINKVVHYDFRDENNSAHSWSAQKNFSFFYQPLWRQLLLELVSVILNPFIFVAFLPERAKSLVDYVQKISKNHERLGWICGFSLFGNENTFCGTPEEMSKMERSMRDFQTWSIISTDHNLDLLEMDSEPKIKDSISSNDELNLESFLDNDQRIASPLQPGIQNVNMTPTQFFDDMNESV